jgi:hypothetical protein
MVFKSIEGLKFGKSGLKKKISNDWASTKWKQIMGGLPEGLSGLMESSGCAERGLGADAGGEPRALRPSPSLPPPGAPLGRGDLRKPGRRGQARGCSSDCDGGQRRGSAGGLGRSSWAGQPRPALRRGPALLHSTMNVALHELGGGGSVSDGPGLQGRGPGWRGHKVWRGGCE